VKVVDERFGYSCAVEGFGCLMFVLRHQNEKSGKDFSLRITTHKQEGNFKIHKTFFEISISGNKET